MANDFDHLIFTREHCSQSSEPSLQTIGIQLLLMTVVLVLITLPSASFAGGLYERVEGSRGGYSRSISSGCAGGSCSRSYNATGLNGGQFSSAQNITRTSPGQFSSSHTASGPDGKSASLNQSTACGDGSCTHTATAVGPNGQSASSSNTVTQNSPGRYSSTGTVTGPQETYSTNAVTNCANGGCVHGATVVGSSGGRITQVGAGMGAGGVVVMPPKPVYYPPQVVVAAPPHPMYIAPAAVVTVVRPAPAVVLANPAPVYVAPAAAVAVVPPPAVVVPVVPRIWVTGYWSGAIWVAPHWH